MNVTLAVGFCIGASHIVLCRVYYLFHMCANLWHMAYHQARWEGSQQQRIQLSDML